MWLGTALTDKLGGAAKLASAIGEATMIEAPTGLALRAAKVPPIGPAGRPDDVGAIPHVARALAPLRIVAKGDTNVAHLGRWTAVASTPWNNAAPTFEVRPSKARREVPSARTGEGEGEGKEEEVVLRFLIGGADTSAAPCGDETVGGRVPSGTSDRAGGEWFSWPYRSSPRTDARTIPP